MDEEAAMTTMGLERESYCRREQREEGLRCKGLQRAGVLGGFVKKKYQKSETCWLRSGALYGIAAVVRLATFDEAPGPSSCKLRHHDGFMPETSSPLLCIHNTYTYTCI